MNTKMKSTIRVLALAAAGVLASSTDAVTPNYGEALQKSIYFYEAQQGGELPAWNRVEWRDDAVLDDGSDVGLDLSGGWFDAGDHVKFGFPMAASATMLAWSVLEYPQAYQGTGQMQHIKNNLRFVADYFVAAHPEPNVLYGQIGSGSADHAWWGSPEVVHLTSRAASNRPSYKIDASCPGSDLAGETAAALAAISQVFSADDATYSAKLLGHARDLHTFAHTYRGKYSDCITDAQAFYNSWSGYNDELVWSSIWLYKATGEQAYLNAAKSDYNNLNLQGQSAFKSYKWTHAWDDKSYGSYVLMATLTGDAEYKTDSERWLDYWTTGFQGERISCTAGGLAQLDTWGATRYAANTSFIALVYSDYLKQSNASSARAQTYYDFAVGQMEYIMGDNPAGHPFQIGMAPNGPKNPHHRGAHGTWADSLTVPTDSRHLLVGALVGGPGSGDAYSDDRGDFIANEVATDYNAGFTGALARLYLDFGGDPIPESQFPAPEQRDLEYFVEAKANATGPRHIEIAARVYNRSAWPAANTNAVKLRYFIDLSAEMANGYSAPDITVSTAYSQASGISTLLPWGDPTDDIYYVEIDFSGVDIFPGGQSEHRKEVQFRLSLPTTTNAPEWVNEGDPSWDNYNSSLKLAPGIAMYNDGTLLWGQEPSPSCGAGSGINCVPTATDISVTTLQGQALPVMLAGQDTDGVIASYDFATPSNGSLSGTAPSLVYAPNSGFSGVDSFSYSVIDDDGARSELATVSIDVEAPQLPAVSISSPADGSELTVGTPFQLTFVLSNAAAVRALVDGVEVLAGIQGASLTLETPMVVGDFMVELIAQDAQGNDLNASAMLVLTAVAEPVNTPPVANFTATTSGLTVNVDASSSSDADGDALTYNWSFDGISKSGVTSSHTFAAAGDYVVELTVADGQASTSTSEVVSVEVSSGGLVCEYLVDNEWNTGFVATVRLTNEGSTAINGWQVSWAYPSGVSRSNGWNAEVTGDGPYVATPLNWNAVIQPGQSVEFGMQGSKPDGTPAPVVGVTGDLCE